MQDRMDAANGVVVTDIGRYIPPTDEVPAAAVLVRKGVEYARLPGLGSVNCGMV